MDTNKNNASKGDKTYIFRVILDFNNPMLHDGKVNRSIISKKEPPWREIAMLGNHTLYQFADAINESFSFIFDHCFGFYDNIQNQHKSQELYELFVDIGEEHTHGAIGVKKTKISDVFPFKGKKMLFYFDYGDGWRFLAELRDIQPAKSGKSYPFVMDRSGPNPEQYPQIDEL
jgi:hypothetical protein